MAQNNRSAKPKILVDARMVSRSQHGISKYVCTIADGLRSEKDNLPFEPVFLLSKKENLSQQQPWNSFETLESTVPYLSWREWFEIPRVLNRIGAAAFHTPSFSSFPMMPVPYMQTVHDLIHLKFGAASHKFYYRALLKPFAKRAQVLATVSNAARVEIAKWIGRSPELVEVHTNVFELVDWSPANLELERNALSKVGLEARAFFLAVANDKNHKNLEMLREAHTKAGSSMPLIVAHEFLAKHKISRSDEVTFNALLRNARSVLSPSLAEGFGRVPIEALLFGTPVVLSDIPVHREILSDLPHTSAVRFVAPLDVDGWANEFRVASTESIEIPEAELREALEARYAPNKLLQPLIAAYKSLIDGKAARA